jgi:predicted esterase
LRPFIWFFNGSGDLILRLMGVSRSESDAQVHTPGEIELLVSDSHEGGLIDDKKQQMLRNALRLRELTARQVMVPRTKMVAAAINDSPAKVLTTSIQSGFTRIPIYKESIDNIIGFIHIKELFPLYLQEEKGLQEILREVIYVPETMPVPDLWQTTVRSPSPADTVLSLPLRGDTSLSVTVYLPPHYNDTLSFPLLLFFDPHGTGRLPVEKYRSLARRYGYILAGSNDIRNGMSGDDIDRILRLLTDDLYGRFSFDSRRLCAAGFSGGARVATLLALTDPSLRGVAACGGGLPSSGNLPPVRFDLLGFAGKADFNLPELLQLDASLEAQPCRHFLVRFDGTHEWPPATVFEDAFHWFAFNAMRDTLIPRNDTMIASFLKKNTLLLRSVPSADPLQKEYLLAKIVAFLRGLANTSSYEQQLQKVRASASFRKAREDLSAILLEEQGQEQYYLKNFPVQPLSWWKGEIAKMNRTIAQTTGEKHYSSLRVMHYLSLAAFMQTEAALKRHLPAESEKYLSLYKLLDPENPDVWFFDAVYLAQKGEKEAARRSLEKAKELGFSDHARLSRWPEMEGVVSNE